MLILMQMPRIASRPIYWASFLAVCIHVFIFYGLSQPAFLNRKVAGLPGQRPLKVRLIAPQTFATSNKPTLVWDGQTWSVEPLIDNPAEPTATAEESLSNGWNPPLNRYIAASQLTVKPRILHEAELESADTRAVPANGKIFVRLYIDEKGEVQTVEIENSNLPDIFSQAVIDGFGKAQFSPGEIDGLAVKSVLHIELTYEDKF